MKQAPLISFLCMLLSLTLIAHAAPMASASIVAVPSQNVDFTASYSLRAMSHLVLQLKGLPILPRNITVPSENLTQTIDALQDLEAALKTVIDDHPETYEGILNPLLQETLALLRYSRYGSAASPPENLLWAGAAGVPAPETLTLQTRPEVQALQDIDGLWHVDFIHMLAVLDVYLSRPLTPRTNPNGRILSFGGDLLTASLSEQVPADAIGTNASGYFSRQDLLADLHGTLLAIFYDTLPQESLRDLPLSALLQAYNHYYQPESLKWRLQWTIALSSHFGSIERFCQQTAEEIGLDPSTDPLLAQRLEALKCRLYGH